MNHSSANRVSIVTVYRFPSCSLDFVIHQFESLMDGIAQSKNNFLVCGDFNVDNLKKGRAKRLFFDVVIYVDGKLNITSPTRFTRHGSKSCIDNIITALKVFQLQYFVFKVSLSDHLARLAVVSCLNTK